MPAGQTVITGGTAGVGLALARRLAQRGERVVVCGRDRTRVADADAIPGIDAIRCDLAVESDIASLAAELRARGGIRLLVNNAAVQFGYRVTKHDHDTVLRDIDTEIGTNLTGPVKLTALTLPLMLPGSTIVNITSALALTPKRSAPLYCATKAALRSYTTALRYQLADDERGIRVTEAMLPLVDTAMTAGRGKGKISPEQAVKELLDGLDRDRPVVHVGKIRALVTLHRLSPALAARLLRDS
ncbi:SDR family NAD(P)-dependent oxidoreductase [Streptomyces sp. HNM0663]|uniref:SDR family NAD(P)-dependent oxidoreductase n=1 Tax=Streptomyces chengmaiensis TaxID=3040919 RepID=A0ABT6HPU5_9ACTN|nr:SDR family NAD(P)-dependent oxidoreductase [Streptomyces chengmaiensis]MDH2390749.1 SDR family NAD(P)-dependent oxidoreductase [Streptomyces chengmaiensis]